MMDSLVIRDIDGAAQMRAVEELQKEVWGLPDLDVVPLSHLVAAKAAGGFVSYEHGQLAHHSHMLAVKPNYRNFRIGHKLKLAQRERTLAQGIKLMTWTFDPLQSLNAYLNFNKLGVVSDRYFINFYGDDAASFLHRNGTDRLWVTWLLASDRVAGRISEVPFKRRFELVTPLVQLLPDSSPQRNNLTEGLSQELATLEIPTHINSLERQNRISALAWREATRWAFTEAIAAGYLVEDFYCESRDEQSRGIYILRRGKALSDFA